MDLTAISVVMVERGMKSLSDLMTKPVRYSEALELFCLGICPEFELERLIALAAPTRIEQRFQTTDGGN